MKTITREFNPRWDYKLFRKLIPFVGVYESWHKVELEVNYYELPDNCDRFPESKSKNHIRCFQISQGPNSVGNFDEGDMNLTYKEFEKRLDRNFSLMELLDCPAEFII